MRAGTPNWHVVVPVQISTRGKTRLSAPPGVDHARLARAIALDTVAAAAATPGVRLVVVTADPDVATLATEVGGILVTDPAAGLGAAIGAGRGAVPADAPAAVLLGDLPSLRPADLAAGLAACAAAFAPTGTAFVPDLDGTGTVLLAASTPRRLRAAFGPDSARAHARWATRVDLDLPRLRRDVDTAAHLARAVHLGLGPRCAALLAAR